MRLPISWPRTGRRFVVLIGALVIAACATTAVTPTPPRPTEVPSPPPTSAAAPKPSAPTAAAGMPSATVASAAATAPAAAGGALQPCAAANLVSQLHTPVPVTPAPAATKPAAAASPAATPTPRPAPAEDRVMFPEGYQESFKLLLVFDRPDNKQVRVICGNDAAASVAPGQPYPYGSILVMETYRAKQDAAGNVVKDAAGRYIREALLGIFVQRKEAGFGVAYAADRGGEWEYVGYRPDKSFLTAPRNSNACAACHLNQAGVGQDFVFRAGAFRGARSVAPTPAANEVVVDAYAFQPGTLTIKAGTTVKWVNHDEAEHTIVARNNAFRSEVLKTRLVKPGESFSFTFAQPGTYEYICSIHPAMVAKIEVTP